MLLIKVGDQKLSMLFGRFSLFVFFCIASSVYGDFEKFHKQFVPPIQQFQSKKDLKIQTELKKEWKGYKSIKTASLYSEMKLQKIPKREQYPVQNVGPLVFIQTDENRTRSLEYTTPELMFNGDTSVEFFGSKFYFSVNTIIKEARFYPYNQDGIASYFSVLAASDYQEILKEIKEIQKAYKLNDWGVYQLVNKLSSVIYKQEDEKELFQWFVFQKLGYDIKVALAGEHVYSIYAIKQKLYDAIKIRYQKKDYYFLSASAPSNTLVYVHNEIMKKDMRSFDFSLKELPLLQKNYKVKMIEFEEESKKYKISLKYNQNMIDFYKTYPQVEFSVFLNAPMEEVTYNSLVESLKDHINGMKTNKALNFLLHFVQKSFGYKRDIEQFHKEKIMFAEETLFYQYSDCEDRVVLYSYLVKKLFDIDVYALKYSNYMATALYIPLNGDGFMIGSKKYIVADPTYINANIGISMPMYKGKRPQEYIRLQK